MSPMSSHSTHTHHPPPLPSTPHSVGGSLPVAFSYFCEFFTKKNRGAFVIILASFWITGSVFAALVAWAVIPNLPTQGNIGFIELRSWRIYVMLCTIPCLTAAISLLFMPETPYFLYSVSGTMSFPFPPLFYLLSSFPFSLLFSPLHSFSPSSLSLSSLSLSSLPPFLPPSFFPSSSFFLPSFPSSVPLSFSHKKGKVEKTMKVLHRIRCLNNCCCSRKSMSPIPHIEAETKKQDNRGILWKTLTVRSLAIWIACCRW